MNLPNDYWNFPFRHKQMSAIYQRPVMSACFIPTFRFHDMLISSVRLGMREVVVSKF